MRYGLLAALYLLGCGATPAPDAGGATRLTQDTTWSTYPQTLWTIPSDAGPLVTAIYINSSTQLLASGDVASTEDAIHCREIESDSGRGRVECSNRSGYDDIRPFDRLDAGCWR